MSKVWPWVAGIFVAMCILGLLAVQRSERQAYWAARGAVVQHAQVTPHPTDLLMRRAPGQ